MSFIAVTPDPSLDPREVSSFLNNDAYIVWNELERRHRLKLSMLQTGLAQDDCSSVQSSVYNIKAPDHRRAGISAMQPDMDNSFSEHLSSNVGNFETPEINRPNSSKPANYYNMCNVTSSNITCPVPNSGRLTRSESTMLSSWKSTSLPLSTSENPSWMHFGSRHSSLATSPSPQMETANFDLLSDDELELPVESLRDNSPPVYEMSLSDYRTSRFPDINSPSVPFGDEINTSSRYFPGAKEQLRDLGRVTSAIRTEPQQLVRQPLCTFNTIPHVDNEMKLSPPEHECQVDSCNSNQTPQLNSHRKPSVSHSFFKPPFLTPTLQKSLTDPSSSFSQVCPNSDSRLKSTVNSCKRRLSETPSTMFASKLSKLCRESCIMDESPSSVETSQRPFVMSAATRPASDINRLNTNHQRLLTTKHASTGDLLGNNGVLQDLLKLNDTEREETERNILEASELAITLMYSDGTSQLRESADTKVRRPAAEHITVTSLVIGYVTSTTESDSSCTASLSQSDVTLQFIHVPFVARTHVLFQSTRRFIDRVMSSGGHKLCFEGQELVQALVMHYKYTEKQVIQCWSVVDAKIAGWLLDADNCPLTFQQLLQQHTSLSQEAMSNVDDDLSLLGPAVLQLYTQLTTHNLCKLFEKVELPLIPILALLELRGVTVDVDVLNNSCRFLEQRLTQLEKLAHQSAGQTFLINSHVQLRQVLFERLKLDTLLPEHQQNIARTHSSHQKSTSECVLNQLTGLHPLPRFVLNYRQTQKLKSTYVDGMLTCVKDGMIKTCWDHTAAATGRLTASNPNIQAIPRLPVILQQVSLATDFVDCECSESTLFYAREAFVSRPGYMLLVADFQQIELRILAHLSNDDALLELFNKKTTGDVFRTLTAQWLNKSIDEVSQVEREETKRVVYAVMYGVGKDRLSELLTVSVDEAQNIINSFLVSFPGIKMFTRKCIEQTRKQGYSVTIFNRRRLFPHINNQNFQLRSYAERQTVNFCVQGSAADLCKMAMIQVEKALTVDSSVDARLLVQIHDELLVEVSESHVQRLAGLVQQIMESSSGLCCGLVDSPLRVALRVSLSVGKSWAHMTEYKPQQTHC